MRMKILMLGKEKMIKTLMVSKTWEVYMYKAKSMDKTKEIRSLIMFIAGMSISMPAMNIPS